MILCSFFSSVEFYVIMAVIAAAIVAVVSRPQSRGPVMEYLLASSLSSAPTGALQPQIEFCCLDNGKVMLKRSGLEGVFMSGAVSLAVKFDGVNLMIEERLVQGSAWDEPASSAVFEIDFLRYGRYHVRYNSQKIGLSAAFQLHVRPGIDAVRILSS